MTSFDHADLYGGCSVESLFGEALALRPSLRDRVQLVSQCGVGLVNPARPVDKLTTRAKPCDSLAARIRASVEQSLRALRTDHLDLLRVANVRSFLTPSSNPPQGRGDKVPTFFSHSPPAPGGAGGGPPRG